MLVKIYTMNTIKSVRPAEGLGLYVLATEVSGKEVTLSGAILFKNETEKEEEKKPPVRENSLFCGVVDKKISKTASAKVADLIVTLSAIERLTNNCDALEIYTDSSYIAAGWECGWLDKWKNGGWKNNRGESVAHSGYWKEIDARLVSLNVRPVLHIMEHHPWSSWFENEEKLYREGRFAWMK